MNTISKLAKLLNNKEISTIEVAKKYLNTYNELEKEINAYLYLEEKEILKKAEKIDKKRLKGIELSEFAGIPISIKDNICTKDIKTTCASKMLENFIPTYDATVIKNIKDNEMLLFGKLNMDEFAMGSSTENSAFKITKNPCNLDYVPGGSSGGSAASVAANMVVAALGTDTGGSIRQPASYCGLVGLKPTYGRVSRFGLIAFASSFDQIGPITNTVEDAAMLLNVISGYDKNDSTSLNIEKEDFRIHLNDSIKGKRIALVKEFLEGNIDTEVKDIVLNAAKEYEKLGAIVEEISVDNLKVSSAAYYLMSSAEASSNLARYDGIKYGHRTSNYKNLEELYKKSRTEGFGEEVKRRIMLGTYVLSSGYYDMYYKKAQKVRTLIINEFKKIFENYDVILTPTSLMPAFKIGSKIDSPIKMYATDICTVPASIAGLPAISINAGYTKIGLPVGIQLISKAFDEKTILNFANVFEKNVNYKKLRGINYEL